METHMTGHSAKAFAALAGYGLLLVCALGVVAHTLSSIAV
jgi:hypothetical protein